MQAIVAARRLVLEAPVRQETLRSNQLAATKPTVRPGPVKVLRLLAPTARHRGLRRLTTTTIATIQNNVLIVRHPHVRIRRHGRTPRRAAAIRHRRAPILHQARQAAAIRHRRALIPHLAILAEEVAIVVAAVVVEARIAAGAEVLTAAAAVLTHTAKFLPKTKPVRLFGRAFFWHQQRAKASWSHLPSTRVTRGTLPTQLFRPASVR